MIPLGLAFGFGGSIVSHIFDIFKVRQDNKWKAEQDKRDKAHEISIFGQQIEMRTLESNERVAELQLHGGQVLDEIVYNRPQAPLGTLIGNAEGLVRPSSLAMVLGCWASTKVMMCIVLMQIDPSFAITNLWTIADQTMLETLLSYYFGNRGISAARRVTA